MKKQIKVGKRIDFGHSFLFFEEDLFKPIKFMRHFHDPKNISPKRRNIKNNVSKIAVNSNSLVPMKLKTIGIKSLSSTVPFKAFIKNQQEIVIAGETYQIGDLLDNKMARRHSSFQPSFLGLHR